VGFDVTDETYISRSSDTGENGAVHQLFIDVKKAYDSVKREV
jgi:hypothetical protein